MKTFYIIFFFVMVFGCNKPTVQNSDQPSEIVVLKNEEKDLQAEIDRLKRQIDNSDDSDEIDDLEDEIDDLEKRLRENRNQQTEVETNPFCNRTPTIYLAIMNQIKTNSIKSDLTSCTEVTTFMISQITTLDLSDRMLRNLKSGDLDHLTELTSLDLSDNELNSLPSDIFNDLGRNTEIKLAGNNFRNFPTGIFNGFNFFQDGGTIRFDMLDNEIDDIGAKCTAKTSGFDTALRTTLSNDEPTTATLRTLYDALSCDDLSTEYDNLNEYKTYFNSIRSEYILYSHFTDDFMKKCLFVHINSYLSAIRASASDATRTGSQTCRL